MRRLHIPKHRREVLISLAKLPAEAVKDLFGALASVPPGKFGPDLPQAVSQSVKAIGNNECIAIVDTLLSLYPLIVSSTKPVNEVIDEIVSAFNNGYSTEECISDDLMDALRSNLQKLLKVPSIGLGAKATGVKFENERNLMNSRVLTDVRPVFQLDSTDIGGAILVHTLKLEYVDSGDTSKEFFVVLDSADIDVLISKLQRAKEKAQKLEEMLAKSSVPLIDSDEL
jgi:hypothetical protein